MLVTLTLLLVTIIIVFVITHVLHIRANFLLVLYFVVRHDACHPRCRLRAIKL